MSHKVTVIMGIYNCAETLTDALDCIVRQTYKDWDVVMCDDFSSDDTLHVAEKYVQKYPDRFILLKNTVNKGLNYTLNKCLKYADGEYIARMDGDDLCSPERFEKEVKILDAQADIAIVSTQMSFFDDNGTWGRTSTKARPQEKDFLRSTPFCHAACMVRKEAYAAVGGYSVGKNLLRVEDYHLWVKMYAKGYRGFNIPEVLYQMRDDMNARKRKKLRYRFSESYVKALAVRELKLPLYSYLYCIKPVLIGLLPGWMYTLLHKKKRSIKSE